MSGDDERPGSAVIMGSDSDWSVMQDAADALAEFDVPPRSGWSRRIAPRG